MRLLHSDQDVALLLRLAKYYSKYGAHWFNSEEYRCNVGIHRRVIQHLITGMSYEELDTVGVTQYEGVYNFNVAYCTCCGTRHSLPITVREFLVTSCRAYYCTHITAVTCTTQRVGGRIDVTNFQPVAVNVLNLSLEDCETVENYILTIRGLTE